MEGVMRAVTTCAILCMVLFGCGGGQPVSGPKALEEFGVATEAVTEAQLTLAPPNFSKEKALDVLVALLFIAVLYGIGRLFKAAAPNFQPLALVGLGVAVVAVFFTNRAFYEFKSATADERGVTVSRYVGDEERIEYEEVKEVRVEPGSLFPVFSDDRMLVLVGEGRQVSIPFFVPERERLGALLKARLRL